MPAAETAASNPPDPLQLNAACESASPNTGESGLIAALQPLFPGLRIRHALTRGGWHRLGGVVDGEHRPVASNIRQWAEQESAGDIDQLVAKYLDAGYFATHIEGKTHFLVASAGEAPEAFMQIEVEELQEEVERILIDADWQPDDIEEFLDPLDYPLLEPEPVDEPHYLFRRLFDIQALIASFDPRDAESEPSKYRRFLYEWTRSSAGQSAFCEHWVFAVQETLDSDGDTAYTAKPISTHPEGPAEAKALQGLTGTELAKGIQRFDKILGYPMAWYFFLVTHSAISHDLASRIHQDHQGEYAYLAKKDLDLLENWLDHPYAL